MRMMLIIFLDLLLQEVAKHPSVAVNDRLTHHLGLPPVNIKNDNIQHTNIEDEWQVCHTASEVTDAYIHVIP
jgi:hypothetical protein